MSHYIRLLCLFCATCMGQAHAERHVVQAKHGRGPEAPTNNIRVHPVPAEFVNKKRFAVYVNNQPVPVFHAGLNIYFVSFDFTGKVDIRVDAKDTAYWKGNALVKPASALIGPVTHDRTVNFSLTKSGQYAIEKPGVSLFGDEVLFVFANPPEKQTVRKTDKNTLYLAAGIHQQHVNLKTGQTLYLEAGAVLFGSINVWDASNVRIMGRGVVMHYGPQSEDEDFGWINKKSWHPLTTHQVKGLYVDGITFIGRSRTWTIQTHTTFDAVFDNIKILAVNPQNINGDGIDWYGGGRTKVINSLIKSMDDCFAFFTPGSSAGMWNESTPTAGEVSNIYIENCVLWPSLANVFRIGFNGQALTSKNITMKNCDVIHFNNLTWQAPASLVCVVSPNKKGKAVHSAYLFEDIRFETPAALLGLQNPEAALHGFIFRNIVMKAKPVASMINSKVSNFTFDNVVLQGKVILKEADLLVNDHPETRK